VIYGNIYVLPQDIGRFDFGVIGAVLLPSPNVCGVDANLPANKKEANHR
jgi:hypothetical protein